MWFCFNNGFLSVVADTKNPSRLMARARRKIHLTNIFGPSVDIVETSDADYRWRTFVDRAAFKEIVSAAIDDASYTNFKNSVKEDDLRELYSEFWSLHRRYGKNDRSIAPEDKPRARKVDRSSHFAWKAGDIVMDPPKK